MYLCQYKIISAMRFVDIKNDVAFRKIFGNTKKTKCLISFLNAVLGLEGTHRVAQVTLVDPYLLPRIKGEKASIIDVRATDLLGRQFIVEMQVADKDGFNKRVQYYAAKDYSLQIQKGDDYSLLRPTYFIGILNFPFGKNESYHTKHLTIDQETGEHLLTDIQFAFIQLTKFKKKAHELVTMVDKWTYFIKNARKLDVIPENTDDEGLRDAYDQAERYNWSKDELMNYDVAGMREQDARGELSKAKRDGKEEGEEEAKNKIARASLSKGLPVLLVAEITDLPIEKVQKIADELAAE